MSGFSYDNLSMTKNAIGRSFRWCNGEGTDPRGVAIGKKAPRRDQTQSKQFPPFTRCVIRFSLQELGTPSRGTSNELEAGANPQHNLGTRACLRIQRIKLV
jgi:hypothetical protein